MCFDGALIDTETSFQRHLLAGDSCPLGFALHPSRGVCLRAVETVSMEELNLAEDCTSESGIGSHTFNASCLKSVALRAPAHDATGQPDVKSWSIRVGGPHPSRQIISRPPPSARDRSYRLISRLRRR